MSADRRGYWSRCSIARDRERFEKASEDRYMTGMASSEKRVAEYNRLIAAGVGAVEAEQIVEEAKIREEIAALLGRRK